MESTEKQQLEQALGLPLQPVTLDWAAFKQQFELTYTSPEQEETDREHFTWLRFRGDHLPQSCLLYPDGRVRGLILRETSLERIQLPALPGLEYLCISGNKKLMAIDWAEEYPALQYADLSDNHLSTLKLPAQLPWLCYLSLRNNQIRKFVPGGILPELEELDLSQNRIKNWEAVVIEQMPALKYLFLLGNPLNESVTTYRLEGEDCNYLRSLQQLRRAFGEGKPVKNNEYKVLVVGDGKAGKSCLVARLVENKFITNWDSTHGIAVTRFDGAKAKGYESCHFPYIMNLWDFGGQDIYHHTHRLFMQTNAIYILLWSEETEFKKSIVQTTSRRNHSWENKKIAYWLAYIQHLGGNSPVVVAQTQSPPHAPRKAHPEESALSETYKEQLGYLSSFLHLDAKAEDVRENGYKRLLNELESAVDSLDREENLPQHWIDIRDALEQMKPVETADNAAQFMSIETNTLGYDEFVALAKEKGEQEDPDRLLQNWLVRTGVVFYKPGLFDNKIILNQAWAIRAVYALFDRSDDGFYHDIKDQDGRFDGQLLNNCWCDYGEPERKWFLDFMLAADMCFEITPEGQHNTPWDQREFVALEMLPTKRPAAFLSQEETWADKKSDTLLHLIFRYPFLHSGVIQRFIARTYRFAEVRNIYKNGVLLKVDNTFVLVEAQLEDERIYRGEIRVTVARSGIRSLYRVQEEFKDIHNSQSEDKVEQWVMPTGKPAVRLNALVEQRAEKQMVAVDGTTIVNTADYLLFIKPDEEKVAPLSGMEEPVVVAEAELLEQEKTSKEPVEMIDQIKNKIGQGRLEDALKLLQQHYPSNGAIAIQQDFSQLKNNDIKGILSPGEISIGRSKIVNRMLDFLSELEQVSEPAPRPNPIRSSFPDDDYPKLEQNIIEVDMVAGAREYQPIDQQARIKILMLSASPMDAGQLNTGKESRFKDLIQYFDEERKIDFREEHGLNGELFQNFLFTQDPHIIHFGGHGEKHGLVLEKENLDTDLLIEMVENTENLQLVVLNACYTLPMAQEVARCIPYVIGTQGALPDRTAIAFARGFYTGIAANKSIEASFKNGITAIKREKLPGADIPILVKGKRQ